jgi:hypothetical protein
MRKKMFAVKPKLKAKSMTPLHGLDIRINKKLIVTNQRQQRSKTCPSDKNLIENNNTPISRQTNLLCELMTSLLIMGIQIGEKSRLG